MANGGDIIIKGSSVDIQYDDSLYTKHGTWNHKNDNKKITRITVSDEDGNLKFDSGEDNGGLKWEIKAYCK